jgi:hypothetical protein
MKSSKNDYKFQMSVVLPQISTPNPKQTEPPSLSYSQQKIKDSRVISNSDCSSKHSSKKKQKKRKLKKELNPCDTMHEFSAWE